MSLYSYSNSHEDRRNSFDEEKESIEFCKKPDHKPKEDCEKDDCDSESAKALKKILSLIDDLNNEDLHILKELIDRLLCSRDRKHPF